MSWMSRNSSGHGRHSRSPLACRICWAQCNTNWNISRMLKNVGQSFTRATGTPGVTGALRNPLIPSVSRGRPRALPLHAAAKEGATIMIERRYRPLGACRLALPALPSSRSLMRTSGDLLQLRHFFLSLCTVVLVRPAHRVPRRTPASPSRRGVGLSHPDAHERLRARPSVTATLFIRSLISAHGRPSKF